MRHVHIEAPIRTLSLDILIAGKVLAVIAVTVISLGWIREVYVSGGGDAGSLDFLRLYDAPHTLTNWLQPILLVIAAGLLAVIAALARQDADPQWRRWLALAGLFAFMSLDEAVNIDGHIATFVAGQIGTSDPVKVLTPFVVVAAALGGFFAPLLASVPRRDAIRFVCCAAIFVGGALGMEIVSQVIGNASGKDSGYYVLAAGIEESLETIGATLFCLALGSYAAVRWHGWSVMVFRSQRAATSSR